ncbi:unnamed protein product [Adineta steineri]|uniref:Uncharacterized protein n=1 Tax=Adineta steineri TaxID=433720 RepID=A0A813Y7P4_9BILA|nr:unnamed protein product [Adineta steineri]CAF0914533.1 unnamed protein product [Adineta steineri]CAF1370582.1 unnamed protein product [Adineta steineri]
MPRGKTLSKEKIAYDSGRVSAALDCAAKCDFNQMAIFLDNGRRDFPEFDQINEDLALAARLCHRLSGELKGADTLRSLHYDIETCRDDIRKIMYGHRRDSESSDSGNDIAEKKKEVRRRLGRLDKLMQTQRTIKRCRKDFNAFMLTYKEDGGNRGFWANLCSCS